MRIITVLLALTFLAGTCRSIIADLGFSIFETSCTSEGCVMVCESVCDTVGSSGCASDDEEFPVDRGACCIPMACCYCCCFFQPIQSFSLNPPPSDIVTPRFADELNPRSYYCEVFHPPEVMFT